jgi:acyl-CoA thioesterase I
MYTTIFRSAFLSVTFCVMSFHLLADDTSLIQVACIGDSITYGARLKNRNTDSYPAKLQALLGIDYKVSNFGVGSCTLIRKGKPNVWSQLQKIAQIEPDIVIICLGTNDTCGGRRKCWDHKDDFPVDCRDLLDFFLALPSKPHVSICAPTPMVLETPGLSEARVGDLIVRKPRLQELIEVIRQTAKEKNVGFIGLNKPLSNKPELFTEKDGVHPNKAGYERIAELVYSELKKKKRNMN